MLQGKTPLLILKKTLTTFGTKVLLYTPPSGCVNNYWGIRVEPEGFVDRCVELGCFINEIIN